MSQLDEQFLRRAVDAAKAGIAAGQTPFGAVIVRHGQPIATTHNTVWRDGDPTAHAEVNAIRLAARALGTIDLSGSVLYSTCEPCPMCLAAAHWAKIARVVYGAAIADAQAAGFTELVLPAATLVTLGRSPMKVEGGLLHDECVELFARWRKAGRSAPY